MVLVRNLGTANFVLIDLFVSLLLYKTFVFIAVNMSILLVSNDMIIDHW